MSAELSQWLPGILVLAGGLVAGLIVSLWLTRGDAHVPDLDAELDDLEQRKDHLVAQLRDLESQRGKLDPATYAAQKTEYERQAAEALRARNALASKRRAPPPAAKVADRAGRWTWVGLGSVAALVAIASGIYLLSTPPPTRSPAMTPRPTPAPLADPALAEVRARLSRDPADIAALTEGAQILVRAQRFDEAAPFVERALQLEPEHPAALVQLAALRLAQGQSEAALTVLNRVIAAHPEELEAHSLRGMVALERGDRVAAARAFDEYLSRAPAGPATDGIARLRRDLDQPTTPKQDGAALWNERCALCHGGDGRGETPMGRSMDLPDLTAATWQAGTSDEAIRRVIREGVNEEVDGKRRMMQPAADLTPAELEALVSLIRSWRR
jgi:cytochrome c-type biogenesis protein CcmH/NrfG